MNQARIIRVIWDYQNKHGLIASSNELEWWNLRVIERGLDLLRKGGLMKPKKENK